MGIERLAIADNNRIRCPSVFLPESVIPSADARAASLSRVARVSRFFCLRVSWAVAPSALADEASLSHADTEW
jgi:hypothetical protein